VPEPLVSPSNVCTVEHITDNDNVTLIQMVKGSDGGAARRTGLTLDQREGRACLLCGGTDNLSTRVGWVEGKYPAMIHSYHHEQWRLGETI
jgi:hypothetical protein